MGGIVLDTRTDLDLEKGIEQAPVQIEDTMTRNMTSTITIIMSMTVTMMINMTGS